MSMIRKMYYNLNLIRWNFFKPITVGVKILLIKNNSVVLVMHSYQDDWYLPGGGIEKGETLEEAILREAKEEFNCKIKSMKLFGVYTNFYEGKNDHVICTRPLLPFYLTGASGNLSTLLGLGCPLPPVGQVLFYIQVNRMITWLHFENILLQIHLFTGVFSSGIIYG